MSRAVAQHQPFERPLRFSRYVEYGIRFQQVMLGNAARITDRQGGRLAVPTMHAKRCSERTAARVLKHARAIRHRAIGREQHDLAVFVREAKCQHFGHELPDLAWWEVDHRGNLTAE
jgi:hypothetical protein